MQVTDSIAKLDNSPTQRNTALYICLLRIKVSIQLNALVYISHTQNNATQHSCFEIFDRKTIKMIKTMKK